MSKKIKFVPRWTQAIQGHAINAIRKAYPRLCSDHEFDDLLQEAYIVFMRCKRAFRQPVYGTGHAAFMALFRTALHNHLMNLAKRSGRMLLLEDLPPQTTDRLVDEGIEGFARCVLAELSDEVRQLIREVCFSPEAEGRAAFRKLKSLIPSLN